MNLDFRKDQKMIRKAAREFLDKECPRDPYVRDMELDDTGFTPQLWDKMAELGWLGLTFPEAFNGMGCDFIDLAIILEEMGRACLPGPFVQNILAGMAILWFGSDNMKKQYLPDIADGKTIMTLALNETDATYKATDIQTKAIFSDESITVTGNKTFVPYAHIVDYALLPVRDDSSEAGEQGISLLLLDLKSPGISTIRLEDTIAKDKLFNLELTNVVVPMDNLLGEKGQGWPIVDKLMSCGAVAECARMSGGARQVVNLSAKYAKERKQFGRPVGSFQIIQHYLADMLTIVDGSHYLTFQAAFKLAKGESHQQEISLAKAFINDAYYKTCVAGHQIHGGVGFTAEFDVGLYFRRAKAQELSFGDTNFHLDIIASNMGLN